MNDFELEMIEEGRDAELPDHDWAEQEEDPLMEYQGQAMDEMAKEAQR
jgi:hypothetical protein